MGSCPRSGYYIIAVQGIDNIVLKDKMQCILTSNQNFTLRNETIYNKTF